MVNWNLGAAAVNILANDGTKLSVDLGEIRIDVLKSPFAVQVFRNGALISSDTAQGLEYIAGDDPTKAAVANFKSIPANARYYGFGEKAGAQLDRLNTSMTFFNYDNYEYEGQSPAATLPGSPSSNLTVIPPFSAPGPLNYAEPLYNSVPLLIEDNPDPVSGSPYSYGLLFDNEAQSYFNIGQSSSYAGNMYGKYYFGALYGDLDYYFMAGETTAQVVDQYTLLTGRPALPPMYALGYHQGCYGYYDQQLVVGAIDGYRAAGIPIDGVHIDVDFQNNYRTFTASPEKFPGGGGQVFAALRQRGVKASTNVTGIVSMVPVDETDQAAPYPVLDEGLAQGYFYADVRIDDPSPPSAPQPLVVNESYGCNLGFNPYPSPGAPYDPSCGGTPLGTYGHYADLGRPEVRRWWGTLYQPLLDAGLSMVWQDMTDPATEQSSDDTMPWKTLPLNLAVFDPTTASTVAHAQIHNVFALNLIGATYEGLRQHMPGGTRPFIIARGGYAGVQRYAASWTGDSASTWDFLSILIPEILNFGLSGQPMAGADVGGFATGPGAIEGNRASGIADPELLTRWTTLSAFIGWFRNHYDGYNKQYQEPFAYPQTAVAAACRKYIEIRYKLLQHFYDLSYESSQTGLPICRPLFLTDRADPTCYDEPVATTQFMVGHDILVAPVVQQGVTSRNVYLPNTGQWFAYQDNLAPLVGPNEGGSTIDWYVPWDIVPVYVRAGAIILRRELEQYVGQAAAAGGTCPLTFDIYPGPASSHQLYLDDKVSTRNENGAYRLTEISQSRDAAGAQLVRVQRLHDGYTPIETFYYVALLQAAPPTAVDLDGSNLPLLDAGSDDASADALAASAVNAYYYNTSLETAFVKIFDLDPDVTLAVS